MKSIIRHMQNVRAKGNLSAKEKLLLTQQIIQIQRLQEKGGLVSKMKLFWIKMKYKAKMLKMEAEKKALDKQKRK